MTITVHVENTVHDFDAWKEVFDRFDRFRAEQGVRSYRMTRGTEDPRKVIVDLEFDDAAHAEAFRLSLLKVWETPQSKLQLLEHAAPLLLETVEERVLSVPG